MGLSLTFSAIQPVTAVAAIAENDDAMTEMVLGDADARITVIEYASLGCPHCANFHANTFPDVKKDYIDTGKIKFVYRDFPLGTPALAASMIARCAGSAKYFGMVDIFFKSQQQWSRADNPLDALKKVSRFGGMSEADVDACLQNQELLNHIQETARKGGEDHKINATPSFVIDGETISGGLPYEDFKKLLDKALNKSI
ncbi:MAG: DsbA family protein [Rhodospirillales bacterium]|nr:DsbA family protein [Rhodospirillales bacterium]